MGYLRLAFAACLFMTAWALAAQQRGGAEQSPRQAMLEMFSGGDEQFKKHLTVEVQAKISEQLKSSGADPTQSIRSARAAGGQGLETFESGPILFSFNNAQQHERLEVRIDGDDLRGDEDNMELSVHAFRNGVEQDLPVGFRLQLAWKQQQGIWRVNAITVSATVPVGDPRILDKTWWTPPAINSLVGG